MVTFFETLLAAISLSFLMTSIKAQKLSLVAAGGGQDPHFPCAPIAVLQKTHIVTKRFLASAKQAKYQVEQCGGYHRVLYYSDPVGSSSGKIWNGTSTYQTSVSAEDKVSQDMALLQAALGKDGVIGFGPADISIAMGQEWDKLLAKTKTTRFMWHTTDAFEMTW